MANLQEDSILQFKYRKEKEYWKEKLLGKAPLSKFPNKKMGNNKSPFIDSLNINFSKEITSDLNKLTNNSVYSLHIILITAISIILRRHSNQKEVIIGTPIYKQKVSDGLINTLLPIQLNVDENITFKELLGLVKTDVLESSKNQNYPVNTLLQRIKNENYLGEDSSVIDVLVMLESIHSEEDVKELNASTLFYFSKKEGSIQGVLKYNAHLYDKVYMQSVCKHLMNFIENALQNIASPIKEIQIISDSERVKLLYEFNDNKSEINSNQTIIDIIEENSRIFKDDIAVVCDGEYYTYLELNERANQIANNLVQHHQLNKEEIVGVLMERSLDMAAVILGIWKAGGVYVPLDPMYPFQRMKSIADESKMKVIFSQESFIDIYRQFQQYSSSLEAFTCVDSNNIYFTLHNNGEASELSLFSRSFDYSKEAYSNEHLAYIIYTSGSTGAPKGVMVEHIGMINHILAKVKDLNLDRECKVVQNASQCFDISIWQFFSPLVVGGTTVIYQNKIIMDPKKLIKQLVNDQITVFQLVPTYLKVILECLEESLLKLPELKYLVVTGEELKPNLVHKWFELYPEIKVVNAFGPTEASDDITHYIMDKSPELDAIPIGNSLQNFNIYVVDEYENLCPIGVKGEIWVSGIGVGRGYLNEQEKTNKVFSFDPFLEGKKVKLYKTGDLGYWLESGNLYFSGRKDYQVKVRGHRIELGEIERTLVRHPNIIEAVVIDRLDNNNNKYLIAYIVFHEDQDIEPESVTDFLGEFLPEYMIPQHIVELQQMPINSNGKVDRKALPEPRVSKQPYEFNLNIDKVQRILIDVFTNVFGMDVYTDTAIFDLGLDSIKAMQIVSRLQRNGLDVEIKDVFNSSTIKQLSKCIKRNENTAEQGLVEGEVLLTPIQHWFFKSFFTDKHHFNQAVLLHNRNGIKEEILLKSVQLLLRHHDALRMVFDINDDKQSVRPKILGVDGKQSLIKTIHLNENEDITEQIKESASGIHEGMNLFEGPLFGLGLFKTNDAGDYLLLSIHHLICDAVSLRVLLEDLTESYSKLEKNETVSLQDKTNSIKEWAEKINIISSEENILRERKYWSDIENSDFHELPRDFILEPEHKKVKNFKVSNEVMSKDVTEIVLKEANNIFETEINDLLIATFGKAVKDWCGKERILINLEGHGREKIAEDINVNRTIGWFTTLFPVLINTTESHFLDNIKEMSKTLKNIPNKGLGYGIQRYLSSVREESPLVAKPEIMFNYLGEIDHTYQDFELIDINMGDIKREMKVGSVLSPNLESVYTLEVSAEVIAGELSISIGYNSLEYREGTIRKLLDCYLNRLTELSEHVKMHKDRRVCYLSSAQKRIYISQELEPESTVFNIPIVLEITGELNANKVEYALKKIVQRHEILRTSFKIYEHQIIQMINDDVSVDFQYIEPFEDKVENIAKTFVRPFNLEAGYLLRVILAKKDDNKYLLMFDTHHIVCDGMSVDLLIKEFSAHYQGIELPPLKNQYKDFVKWQAKFLQSNDIRKQEEYWINTFKGPIPELNMPYDYPVGSSLSYQGNAIDFEFTQEMTRKLSGIAQKTQTTMHMLIFSIYNILLQKYTGQEDIVVGIPHAGRAHEGVEDLIGMFVNTLAVRTFPNRIKRFDEYLFDVKEVMLEAYRNQDYQYDELVYKLSRSRESQLFSTMFSPQTNSKKEINLHNLSIRSLDVNKNTSQFPFELSMLEEEKALLFELRYQTNLFKEETMEVFKNMFIHIAQCITENLSTTIEDISIFDDSEKEKLQKMKTEVTIDVDF